MSTVADYRGHVWTLGPWENHGIRHWTCGPISTPAGIVLRTPGEDTWEWSASTPRGEHVYPFQIVSTEADAKEAADAWIREHTP